MKKALILLFVALLSMALIAGCGKKEEVKVEEVKVEEVKVDEVKVEEVKVEEVKVEEVATVEEPAKEEPKKEEPKKEEPKKEEPKKEEPKKEEPKKEEPKKEEPKKEEPKKEDSKFKEENGLLTYLDIENSPFDGLGIKIIIKKGKDGYAKFIKTDLTGTEGVDYYIFDYAKNTFEKYYFVSAMGNGYFYYYDLEKQELTKVEDKEHNDSTQKMKDSKRWDSAITNTKEDIQTLEEYFAKEYNSKIKEFVIGN